MYEVGLVLNFRATHALLGDFGPASRPHGHDYRVEISVRGSTLSAQGTLVDIAALEQAARSPVAAFDNADLNRLEEFQDLNPTAENVAHHLFGAIAAHLPEGPHSLTVKVWESAQAYGAYEGMPGELPGPAPEAAARRSSSP